MAEIPKYPPVEDPVARSVAKPTAFAKPGVQSKSQGTRFRPLKSNIKAPAKLRRKRDPRKVIFY